MERDDDPSKRSDHKLALATAIGTMLFILLFGYSAHGSIAFNAIRLPFEDRLISRLFFPQGWKFFTRDSQEPTILPFREETDGAWTSALLGANGDRRNWFGLTRRPRAQGVEVGLLLEKAPADWPSTKESRCEGAPAECLKQAPVAARIRNITPHPTLCGTIGIVAQRQVPWAWSRDRRHLVMPSHVIKLEVQC